MLTLSSYSWSDPTSHAKIWDSPSLFLIHWLFQHFISWLATEPRFLRTETTRIPTNLSPSYLCSLRENFRLKNFFWGWGWTVWARLVPGEATKALVWNKIYPPGSAVSACYRRGFGKQTQRETDQRRTTLGQSLRINTRGWNWQREVLGWGAVSSKDSAREAIENPGGPLESPQDGVKVQAFRSQYQHAFGCGLPSG